MNRNKSILQARIDKMIATSHNTPSRPPRNFRMISIELIWRTAVHSPICTIRKEHPRKTDMHQEKNARLIWSIDWRQCHLLFSLLFSFFSSSITTTTTQTMLILCKYFSSSYEY